MALEEHSTHVPLLWTFLLLTITSRLNHPPSLRIDLIIPPLSELSTESIPPRDSAPVIDPDSTLHSLMESATTCCIVTIVLPAIAFGRNHPESQ